MVGLISTFLISFIFALILTLGIVVTIRKTLLEVFGKKEPSPSAEPVPVTDTPPQKSDPLQSLGMTVAVILFTVGLWYVAYDTACDIWKLFKAGQ